MDSTKNMKPSKTKSFLRTEAFWGVSLLTVLLFLYVYFFLSYHVKWALERSAFQSIGGEVNIASLKINFFDPSMELSKIEITNPEKPIENFFEVKTVMVKFLYRPLLRGSFISDLTKVEGLQFHTERRREGRVLPPEQRVLVFKDPTKNKIDDALKKKYDQSILSDLSDLIGGKNKESLKKEYEEKLDSLKASQEIEDKVKEIKKNYQFLEDFVESPAVKNLLDEIKDFKFESGSSAETLKSTSEALKLTKELKEKKKTIESKVDSIQADLKTLETEIKQSPENFIKDVDALKAALDPSQLSPAKLSESILSDYFSVQLGQVSRVTSSLKNQALGKSAKYVNKAQEIQEKTSGATKGIKQGDLEQERNKIITTKGRDFLFYRKALLPKYWFQKIDITSKSSESQDLGDVEGVILNFASPQELASQPLKVDIKGSAPKDGIGKFGILATIDHRLGSESTEEISIDISDYLLRGAQLFKGEGELIEILKAQSGTQLFIKRKADGLNLNLVQNIYTPDYHVEADNKNLQSLLEKLKTNKKDIYIKLGAAGELHAPKISFESNFGGILLNAIQTEIKDQVNQFSKEQVAQLKSKAEEKLSPYLKEVNLTMGDLESLDANYDKIIESGLQKLREKNEDKLKKKVEDKAKEALDKLFKKL